VNGARQHQSRLRQFVAGRGRHQCHHPRLVEAVQGEALHVCLPAQVRENRCERVGACQVGVAIGAEDEQAERHGRAHQVLQQQQLGRSGPLQVVEHENDGLVLRGHREEARHRIEQHVALGLRLGDLRRRQVRNPPAELGDQTAELTAVLPDVSAQHVFGRVRDVVPERLD
jgi:hypothetical protein